MALRILLLTLIYVSSATALKASQACASDGKGKSASLARGVALFEEKRYPQARQEFLEATRRDPGSAEAFFYLGMAEAHLRNAPAAERCLRHALERSEERRVGKECRSRWSPYFCSYRPKVSR